MLSVLEDVKTQDTNLHRHTVVLGLTVRLLAVQPMFNVHHLMTIFIVTIPALTSRAVPMDLEVRF